MKVTFRQGIARYQTDIYATPIFLQKSTQNGQFIDLVVSPDPTVIIFAHKNATYVYEEVKTVRNAWGPFNTGVTQYLYWDIDLLTAALTRGITTLPPIFAGIAPPAPAIDQHWFDTINTVMKVWNGNKWIEKIRVFAATYSSSAVIKPYPLGTQAGLNNEVEAGSIVLDSFFKPLRQSDGSFVTSTSNMSVVSLGTRRVRFEADLASLLANEYIPKFSLVQVRQGRRAVLARSTDIASRVMGIAIEDMYEGETSVVVTGGLVRNEMWNWPSESINRPVFCGPTGQVTLVPPTSGVLQQAGYVYDRDAIYMQIFPSITLDDPYDTGGTTPIPPDPGAPVADFSVSPLVLTGEAPFVVSFLDTSLGSPTGWEWDFTNDGNVDSTVQNPSYTYASPGTYSVRLKAINGSGTDEEVKTNYITVTAPPPSGTTTNLEINIGGPMTVTRNQLFTVSMVIRNNGYQTATNIARHIEIPNVNGHQVPVTGLPPGSTVTYVNTGSAKRTIVEFPTILSMISGGQVAVSFTVQAPPSNSGSSIAISGTVTSSETDSTIGDNSTVLYIQVRT